MSSAPTDRLEIRLSPTLKARVRRAAEARRESVSQFVIQAVTEAADRSLDTPSALRSLGWAVGTASESGDIVSPAVEPDAWDALRE